MEKLKEKLREQSRLLGLSFFGVAPYEKVEPFVEDSLRMRLEGKIRCAVSIGIRLSDLVMETLIDRPTPLYAFHYHRANNTLDGAAFRLANYLQEAGFSACPIAASQITKKIPQSSHISHKIVALYAGIGWIGRANLLVTESAGARLRLATIFTDAPLPVDRPRENGCGSCRACIDACPAHAIGLDAKEWNYDRCYELLKSFGSEMFVARNICGLCVKACRPKKSGNCGSGPSETSEGNSILYTGVIASPALSDETIRENLEKCFGKIAMVSRSYPFDMTSYYEKEMGPSLRRYFVLFERTVMENELASLKRKAIELEKELSCNGARRANLDVGIINAIQVIVASTKRRASRIPVGDGIFAEAMLKFQKGTFAGFESTYVDYLRSEALEFFNEARHYFQKMAKREKGTPS